MRWMWIIPGLVMALGAICLLGLWSRRARRSGKGEVSLMATVKRLGAAAAQGVAVTFVSRGQEMTFAVPAHLARQFHPGLRGVLTYAGSDFVYFVPREELFCDDGPEGLPQVS